VIHLDGVIPPAQYPKVIKSDEWKKVVPGLVVASGSKVRCHRQPLMVLM